MHDGDKHSSTAINVVTVGHAGFLLIFVHLPIWDLAWHGFQLVLYCGNVFFITLVKEVSDEQ